MTLPASEIGINPNVPGVDAGLVNKASSTEGVHTSTVGSISAVGSKICIVCKDHATGLHFGAVTCEGCKGFFRRSVKKNASFKCALQGNCQITKESRKHCQACRLQACFAVGMRPDLVLSDEDVNKKRELIKANREKRAEKQRLKKNAQEQERLSKFAEVGSSKDVRMTMEEKLLLENLLKSHEISYDFGYEEYDTFRGKDRIASPSRESSSSDTKNSLAWLVASLTNKNDSKASQTISQATSASSSTLSAFRSNTESLTNQPVAQDNSDVFSSLHGTSDMALSSDSNVPSTSCANTEISPEAMQVPFPESTFAMSIEGEFDAIGQNSSTDSLWYLRDLLRSQGLSLAMMEDSNSKQLLQHFCDIMTWGIKKVIEFCKHIPQFCGLSLQDQIVLLRGGCLEMLVLRSYFAFSSSENKYMSDKFQYHPKDFLQAGANKEFVEKYNNLHLRMRKMELQVEEICLLLALVLFSPDRPGLEEREAVEQMQDNIAKTLYAYEHTHKPAKQARNIYCEILLILPILRTINMLFSSNITNLQETNESDMNPLILEVNSPASNESDE